MKKLRVILLFICVLFTSIIFSACGDPYKNLTMSFRLGEKEISNLTLFIDRQNPDKKQARLSVNFAGIDALDIGSLAIYTNDGQQDLTSTNQQNLITVTNAIIDGNNYNFDIIANNVTTGDTKLVVRHIASDKIASIDLVIKKKANNVNVASDKTYLISVPTQNTRVHTIDVAADGLVTLNPLDSSDTIYFKRVLNKPLPEGVRAITSVVNGEEVITGFEVSSICPNGDTITLYPVTSLDGYDNNVNYPTKTFNVMFAKTIENEDMVMTAEDENYQSYLDENATILLVKEENKATGLNTFNVTINHKDTNVVNLANSDIYLIETPRIIAEDDSDANAIKVTSLENNKFIIKAESKTNKPVKVEFTCRPKSNIIGEVSASKIVVTVKGEIRANKTEVRLFGNVESATNSGIYALNLFDIYKGEDGISYGLGARFNFVPTPEVSMEDFKTMRIKVPTNILNVKLDDRGVNPYYTDSSFETIWNSIDNVNADKNSVKNSQYLLDFYKGSAPLGFYYDTKEGVFVSENFKSLDDIYIRYEQGNTTQVDLECYVETYYKNTKGEDLAYLKSAQPLVNHLKFTSLKGVVDIGVDVRKADYGIMEMVGPVSNRLNKISDYDGGKYCIYLDKQDANIYGFNLSSVMDDSAQIISVANFDVEIKPIAVGNGESLKLKHSTDENARLYTKTEYNYSSSITKYMYFAYDESTAVGRYMLVMTYANGYRFETEISVYSNLSSSNIGYNLVEKSGSFTTERFVGYEAADAIVATDTNLEMTVKIDEEFKLNNYIEGYTFVSKFANATTNLTQNINAYIQHPSAQMGDSLNINFISGTCIDGTNEMIEFTITVLVKDYIDILTPSSTKEVNKVVSFFIYRPIKKVNIIDIDRQTSDNLPIKVYANDLLGQEFILKGYSNSNLQVQLDEGVWDYTQFVSVPAEEEILGQSAFKTVWKVLGVENAINYIGTSNQDNNSINLLFKTVPGGAENYTYTIGVRISQFGVEHEQTCLITVNRPVITEWLEVDNLKEYSDGGYYLNLKQKQGNDSAYEIKAKNKSSKADVSHAGIATYLLTENAGGHGFKLSANKNSSTIAIDGNKVTVNEVPAGASKLLIISKDILRTNLDGKAYTNINAMLLSDDIIHASDYADLDSYINNAIVVDLIISNGTATNPYLIQNPNDFWDIKTAPNAYYQLMGNVNLSNKTRNDVIDGFTGVIESYSGNNSSQTNSYILSGVELDENHLNIFTNFAGTIKNVTFNVMFNYNFTASATYLLGVFSVNNGLLENVSIEFSGHANFNGGSASFGCLVAENNGTIRYVNNTVIPARGSIDLTEQTSGNVAFGGLVGTNYNLIIGGASNQVAEESGSEQKIIFAGGNDSYATVDIVINSSLANPNTSIGGLVGLNSKIDMALQTQHGRVVDVKAVGRIVSSSYNVGGVIGKNATTPMQYVVNYNSFVQSIEGLPYKNGKLNNEYAYVTNIVSSVAVTGTNNIGGIVGYDVGGYYLDCHYQIYATFGTALNGNNGVGGIAGYSNNGVFAYCSVMSYRWDYLNLDGLRNNGISTFDSQVADIKGTANVAGVIGNAASSTVSVTQPSMVQTQTSAVLILNSSANAYLQSVNNGQSSSVAGLAYNTQNTAVVMYSYFMGKLSGNVQLGAVVQGGAVTTNVNGGIYSNYVYSVVVSDVNPTIKYEGKYRTDFTIQLEAPSMPWLYNTSINGGYIYLAAYKDDTKPLFELAPTLINAHVKPGLLPSGATWVTEKTLALDYYLFDLDITDEEEAVTLNKLNKEYNTYNVLDLFNITYQPTSVINNVYMSVESANSNIVLVSGDKLVVRGTGSTRLTFRSVLNGGALDSVWVTASLPFGSGGTVKIHENNSQNTINNRTINIAVDDSKQLFVTFDGSINFEGKNYSYAVSTNYLLKLKVTANEPLAISDSIGDYLNLAGTPVSEDEVIIQPSQFRFFVKQYYQPGFKCEVKPILYLTDEDGQVVYDDNTGLPLIKNEGEAATFYIRTAKGASNIALNWADSVAYPNDIHNITATISTDIALESDMVSASLAELQNLFNISVYIKNSNVWELSSADIEVKLISLSAFDGVEQKQTANFKIYFNVQPQGTEVKNYRVVFEINNVQAAVTFTLLSQRIEYIDVKNYVYLDGDSSLIESYAKTDILHPYKQGLIIIDMVQSTAYYDYLEIRDLHGNSNEKILFANIDGVGGERIGGTLLYDANRKATGLRVERREGITSVYIATTISSRYTVVPHTVKVSAYLNNGTLLKEQYVTLEIRMLPGIRMALLAPDYSVEYQGEENEEDAGLNNYLAIGVDAMFRVETFNSNGGVDYAFSSTSLNGNLQNYFTMDREGNGYYTLRFVNNIASIQELLGKKLTITFTTTLWLDSGKFETAKTQMTFTLVPYKIHNISVRANTRGSGDNREIYGNYGQTINNFEFYFNKTDISYYNPSQATYLIDDILLNQDKFSKLDNSLKEIYKILLSINGYEYQDNRWVAKSENTFLLWYDENGQVPAGDLASRGIAYSIENRTLKVEENCSIKRLILEYRLMLDDAEGGGTYNWKLLEGNTSGGYPKGAKFNIRFVIANSIYEPKMIRTESDFLNIQMGDQVSYILGKDLVLTNYNPALIGELNVRSFDGNGHTITIANFAPFEAGDINAGLFTSIAANTLVMNLQVNYGVQKQEGASLTTDFGSIAPQDGNFDIKYGVIGSDSFNYTSVNFGGIAVINNGVITNCKVTGTFAVQAKNLTSAKDFYIGGLVNTNETSGYITNSVSELKIAAIANIGGFAYKNLGTIASSGFNAVNTIVTSVVDDKPITKEILNGLIYGYAGIESFASQVGGFVVNNSGLITMCYSEIGATNYSSTYSIGNMSARDVSSGFVYRNTGRVNNSYVNLKQFGLNSFYFVGFVYDNDAQPGAIENCYAYVNGGKSGNGKSINLFILESLDGDNKDTDYSQRERGLSNCYVVIDTSSSTPIHIKGLTTIPTAGAQYLRKENYSTFNFGDGVSSVWKQNDAISMPTLVSCAETRPFTETWVLQLNSDNITGLYPGWNNIEYTADIVDGVVVYTTTTHFTDYGTKQLPYIISNYQEWNGWFTKNDNSSTAYYRICADIDFSNTAPITSGLCFSGNIQGNGMTISNIRLSTQNNMSSIGLFSRLIAVDSANVASSIRNLNLRNVEIKALQTQAVGCLAGVIEGYKLYNVHVESNSTLQGKNTLGGVAGIIMGEYDIDGISSNVSVIAKNTADNGGYSIYNSEKYINNLFDISQEIQQLSNVYYAGSLFGIVDAYSTSNRYYTIKNAKVNGNIVVIADTVGAAFGLVGKYSVINGIEVKLSSGKLQGYQYAAGVAGENRGVINNASLSYLGEDRFTTAFNAARAVSAGLVGFNNGGAVVNSSVDFDIVKTFTNGGNSIVAGLVGRNVNGRIANSTLAGKILSDCTRYTDVTAGIIGADYIEAVDGMYEDNTNNINPESKQSVAMSFVHKAYVTYNFGVSNTIEDKVVQDTTISNTTIAYWLENLSKFYTFGGTTAEFGNYDDQLSTRKILGFVAGFAYKDLERTSMMIDKLTYTFDGDYNLIVDKTGSTTGLIKTQIGKLVNVNGHNDTKVSTNYTNILQLSDKAKGLYNITSKAGEDKTFICYIIGHITNGFDAWDSNSNTYNGETLAMSTVADSNIYYTEDTSGGTVHYRLNIPPVGEKVSGRYLIGVTGADLVFVRRDYGAENNNYVLRSANGTITGLAVDGTYLGERNTSQTDMWDGSVGGVGGSDTHILTWSSGRYSLNYCICKSSESNFTKVVFNFTKKDEENSVNQFEMDIIQI